MREDREIHTLRKRKRDEIERVTSREPDSQKVWQFLKFTESQ